MSNKIILKKSSVTSKVPTTSDLDYGELAINYADGKLYYKKSDNTIDTFLSASGASGVSSVDGNTGVVTSAQLLTAIKKEDGTGSGLDADLLDGLHATSYARSGANSDITSLSGITGNIGTINQATFATAPTGTTVGAGQVFWDNAAGTMSVGMNANVAGLVNLTQFYYIKATSAITIGQVIMFTGALGASSILTGAPATGISDGTYIMGVAAESIPLNGFGMVQAFGPLKGLDTTAFTDGAILYYNPAVPGGLTATKPSAPNIKVQIAAVTHAGNGGSGSIQIRINPGSMLGGTDSNVEMSTLSDGQVIQYYGSGGYWRNITPTGTGTPVLATSPTLVTPVLGAATATSLKLYNTYTDASNYEQATIDWTSTANTLTLGTAALGTGTPRTINIQSGIGSTTGAINLIAGGGYGAITLKGGSGSVQIAGTDGVRRASIGQSGLELVAGAAITWSSNTNGPSDTNKDVFIYRDAANTLAQRNSTSAQTFNIYNTYTDASNYERVRLSWVSNVLEFGGEGLGTGSARRINISNFSGYLGATLNVNQQTLNNSGLLAFHETNTSSNINVVTRSSDAAVRALTITGQAPFATATTNMSGGDIKVNGGTPVSTGSYGNVILADAGGKVGIGTASPGVKLDILGTSIDARLWSTNTGGKARLFVRGDTANMSYESDGTAQTSILFDNVNGQAAYSYGLGASGYWRLYTAGTERLRIDNAGKVGIGTSAPAAKLDVVGDIKVNSNVNLNSEAATVASTTQTQVASFAVASFRSAKLMAQIYDSVTGEVQISELLIAHNGTTASATEYGVVYTGSAALVSFDVDISGSNVRLLATRTTANSTQYKISETLMVA